MSKDKIDMEEQWPNDTVGICGCGYPLVPCYNRKGERIGVTHRSAEATEWHDFGWMQNIHMELTNE